MNRKKQAFVNFFSLLVSVSVCQISNRINAMRHKIDHVFFFLSFLFTVYVCSSFSLLPSKTAHQKQTNTPSKKSRTFSSANQFQLTMFNKTETNDVESSIHTHT